MASASSCDTLFVASVICFSVKIKKTNVWHSIINAVNTSWDKARPLRAEVVILTTVPTQFFLRPMTVAYVELITAEIFKYFQKNSLVCGPSKALDADNVDAAGP